MKRIYILKPVDVGEGSAWDSVYDKAFAFIVCAGSENEARTLADQQAGDENQEVYKIWLDDRYTSCEILKPGEKSEVILRDFNAA